MNTDLPPSYGLKKLDFSQCYYLKVKLLVGRSKLKT